MRGLWILILGGSILVSACTGSPATLGMRPDFEIMTATGPVSVSIRETPPGMTFADFTHAVSMGMRAARPGDVQITSVAAPYPVRRIVWHVQPMVRGAEAHLMVNVFDGSVPFADAQQTIDGSAPPGAIAYAIRALTRRICAQLRARDRSALG